MSASASRFESNLPPIDQKMLMTEKISHRVEDDFGNENPEQLNTSQWVSVKQRLSTLVKDGGSMQLNDEHEIEQASYSSGEEEEDEGEDPLYVG